MTVLLTILVTVVLVGLLFAGMAIGVMFGREPVKGSCGGLGALGVQGECGICGGKPERCEAARDDAGLSRGGSSQRDL
ncbi:MAG: (Na+)-NQR maturation NqrM [Rehaibacterium terrae]|uniref:(Na+)-NQR maturation NqrM n=1 Tax=Rehaibacterium terrae TaxID=1341696 RepID=UPI00391A50FA